MSAQKPASWAYAEEFVAEDEVVEQARRRGDELGATPVGTGAGGKFRSVSAVPAHACAAVTPNRHKTSTSSPC